MVDENILPALVDAAWHRFEADYKKACGNPDHKLRPVVDAFPRHKPDKDARFIFRCLVKAFEDDTSKLYPYARKYLKPVDAKRLKEHFCRMERSGLSVTKDRTTRKIPFAKVGRINQHDVTLFALGERDFDIAADPPPVSFAEETLNHLREECTKLLRRHGIEPAPGLYIVDGGRVVPFREGIHHNIDAQPLWSAIQERDRPHGQTGDYLAALALYQLDMAVRADNQLRLNGPNATHEAARLNYSMLAQDTFHRLHLLTIQPQFSAGTTRIDKLKERDAPRNHLEKEAEALFRSYRQDGHSKERCYQLIEDELKRCRRKRIVTKYAIKSWFKSRKDLP